MRLIVPFFVSVVFMLTFVFALGIEGVELVSPSNTSWVSGDNNTIGFSFNYTGDDAMVSCELFVENVSVGSNDSVLVDVNSEIFSNVSLSEGANNWYVNCANGTSVNSSVRVLNVDSVGPSVNLTFPFSIDYSSLGELNFSINDSNLSACWYSVNDSVNVSISCLLNGTELVPIEGVNTWKIYANDSFGNVNSASVSFVFDTTNPVASAYCSPSTVDADFAVTCSCSGSDDGSGINDSLTTNDSSPDTSSAGTFNYECSVTDNVGNTDSDTDSYLVLSASDTASNDASDVTITRTTNEDDVVVLHNVLDDEEFADASNISSLKDGIKVMLGESENVSFEFLNEEFILIVGNVSEDSVNFSILNESVSFLENESQSFDLNKDGVYDLKIVLEDVTDGVASFILSSLGSSSEENVKEEKNLFWFWIIFGLVVSVFVIGVAFSFLKEKNIFRNLFKH